MEFDPVIGDQTPAELSCEVAETREQRESDIHKGSKALRLKTFFAFSAESLRLMQKPYCSYYIVIRLYCYRIEGIHFY